MTRNIPISALQFGHYYVVEVSFNRYNPIHRAIAFNAQTGGKLVWLCRAGYEDPQLVLTEKEGHRRRPGVVHEHVVIVNRYEMSHFVVIEEIMAMRPEMDSYKMPGGEP